MEPEIQEIDDAELVFERFDAEGEQRGYVIESRGHLRLFGPEWDGPVRLPVGMDNSGSRLSEAGRLLANGWPSTRLKKAAGVGRFAARRLRLVLELVAGELHKCQCGRDARHFGTCAFRASLSPVLQARAIRIEERRAIRRVGMLRRRQVRVERVRLRQAEKELWRQVETEQRRARRKELATASFMRWMESRAFIRPVDRGDDWPLPLIGSPDQSERKPPGLQALITSRVLREEEAMQDRMLKNVQESWPKFGDAPLGQMEMWHRCAHPKPSFGVFKRMLKDAESAGLVSRESKNTNKAKYVGCARGDLNSRQAD